jgi:hypothetical protein
MISIRSRGSQGIFKYESAQVAFIARRGNHARLWLWLPRFPVRWQLNLMDLRRSYVQRSLSL